MLQLPLLYSGNSFLLDPLHDMQTRYIHVGAATYSYWTRIRQTLTEPAMLVQPPYSHSTRSPIPLLGDPQPTTHWCCHQTLTRSATHADAATILYWTRYTLVRPCYTMCSCQTELNPTLHAGAAAILSLDPLHAGAAATLGVVLVYRDVGESLTTRLQKGSNSRFTPPPL
jgi:hypothetical protein